MTLPLAITAFSEVSIEGLGHNKRAAFSNAVRWTIADPWLESVCLWLWFFDSPATWERHLWLRCRQGIAMQPKPNDSDCLCWTRTNLLCLGWRRRAVHPTISTGRDRESFRILERIDWLHSKCTLTMYVKAFLSICAPISVSRSATTHSVKKCTEFPLSFSDECLSLGDNCAKLFTLLRSLWAFPDTSKNVGSSVLRIRWFNLSQRTTVVSKIPFRMDDASYLGIMCGMSIK